MNYSYPNYYPFNERRESSYVGVPSITESSYLSNLGLNDVKSGSSVPNYEYKLAHGIDASSAYTAAFLGDNVPASFHSETENIGLDEYHKYSLNQQFGSTYLTSASADSLLDSSGALAEVNRKVTGKLRGMNSTYQPLIPAVELRELRSTVGGIADSFSGVVGTLIDLRRGRFDPRKTAKLASNIWLSWSFGVNPLISEAQNITDAIAAHQDHSSSISIGASASTSGRFSYGLSPVNGATGSWFEGKLSVDIDISYKIDAGFRTLYESVNNYGALDHFGVSSLPQQLPLLGWELVPFSWAVDYFVNVGEFLEDTFMFPENTPIYMVQTKRYRITATSSWDAKFSTSVYPGGRLVSGYATPSRLSRVIYKRSLISKLKASPLRIKSSGEIARNSINKALNLASVLAGRKL